MKEDCEEQAAFAAWENKEERIVTFRETEGFEKLTFRTQEDKSPMSVTCASPDIGSCKEGVYETVHQAEGIFLG